LLINQDSNKAKNMKIPDNFMGEIYFECAKANTKDNNENCTIWWKIINIDFFKLNWNIAFILVKILF